MKKFFKKIICFFFNHKIKEIDAIDLCSSFMNASKDPKQDFDYFRKSLSFKNVCVCTRCGFSKLEF